MQAAQKLRAAMVLLALSAAACGDGAVEPAAVLVSDPPRDVVSADEPTLTTSPALAPSATGASEPPVVVISDDGSLAIEVAAADAEGLDLRVRILDVSEWPDDSAGDPDLRRVSVYLVDNRRDGGAVVFDEPVTVTHRIDMSTLDDTRALSGVPVIALMSRSAGGDYSSLDDLASTRAGSVLFASADTTRVGAIIAVDTGTTVGFGGAPPTGGDVDVDALSLVAFLDVRAQLNDDYVDEIDWAGLDSDALASLPEVDDPNAPFTATYESEAGLANVSLRPPVQRIVARSDDAIGRQLIERSTIVDELPADGTQFANHPMNVRVGMLLVGVSNSG